MTKTDALDQLIEAITVDCYDAYEQMSAFHTVFAEEVSLPTGAPRGVKISVSPGLRRACGARDTLIMSA